MFPSARRSAPDARGSCGSCSPKPGARHRRRVRHPPRRWAIVALVRGARGFPALGPVGSRRTGAPLLGRDHHRRRALFGHCRALAARHRPGGGAPDSHRDGGPPCGVTRGTTFVASARALHRAPGECRAPHPESPRNPARCRSLRAGTVAHRRVPAAGREVRQRHRHRPVRRAGARAGSARCPASVWRRCWARCRSAQLGDGVVSAEGQAPPADGCRLTTQVNFVTDGFFRMMGCRCSGPGLHAGGPGRLGDG